MSATSSSLRDRLSVVGTASLAIGGICLAASFGAAAFDPENFFPAYLFAYFFWIGLTLG